MLKEIEENKLENWIHLVWIENEDFIINKEQKTTWKLDFRTKEKKEIRDFLVKKINSWDKVLDLFWNWEFVDQIIESKKKVEITSIDYCLTRQDDWSLVEDKEQEELLKSYNWKNLVKTQKIDLENFLIWTEEKFDVIWLDYMWILNDSKLNEITLLFCKELIKDWWVLSMTLFLARQLSNFTWESYKISLIWTLKELATRNWYSLELEKELDYLSTWNSKMLFLSFNVKKI
jgi:hypothetical protein